MHFLRIIQMLYVIGMELQTRKLCILFWLGDSWKEIIIVFQGKTKELILILIKEKSTLLPFTLGFGLERT